MRESTQPAPAARPAKPNPRPKAAQNVEKNVSSPSKPAHSTDNAPQAIKVFLKINHMMVSFSSLLQFLV
jgi:hypothetical protein